MKEDKQPTSPVTLDEARPDRETFVTTMQAEFGGGREKWDATYDHLEKSWKKE